MPTTMPPILYGTAWKKERTAALVTSALGLGFRGLDTACQPKHHHEPGVGDGVAASGVPRSELYLQTKFTPLRGQDPERVPYAVQAPLEEQVRQSCQASLSNLETSYLDGLVLHSPLASLEQTLRVWRVFEELVDDGRVRAIGISNCYDIEAFRALWDAARVKPAVLQNRFYAQTGYDVELRAFCLQQSVRYQSFWTLTANPHVLSRPAISQLAKRYHATIEQVFLRCLTQSGVVPLVGTTSETHMRDDLAIFDFELADAEVGEVMRLL